MRYVTGMEPANSIIDLMGGATNVAAICGVHRTQVYKWTWANERGGTGGNIPAKYVPKLILAAREEGKELTAADFAPVVTLAEAEPAA